ncbi:hypothetical protein N0V82_003096 [Gnomoniopsis sp. IMI 355080]|nr:hypothetical protein N0V82_003096 [Gnomoniopsis sp. IMI 355080]
MTAFYAEALGSAALEYMLVSNATRLAQSKGLYLATPDGSKLPPEEAVSRQWLWWVLYAYEKHVAFRSGRPSAIDDDYVTCPVPKGIGPNNTCSRDLVQAQIKKSTEAVAEASRQIITAVQGLQITSAMPLWLTFFFPLVGLINLFVYILKYPLAPSVASDLSLMDVMVGHFGYLHYISSSELAFPFPREIASYARRLVNKASREKEASSRGEESQPQQQKGTTHHNNDHGIEGQDPLLHQTSHFPFEINGFEDINPTSNIDIREDWFGAMMPPLPLFGSLGSGSNLVEDETNFSTAGQMQQ